MHMKHFYISIIFVLFSLSAFSQYCDSALKVMSWNIWYDQPYMGKLGWEHRKAKVFDLIEEEKPDLMGLQEVLLNQLNDLVGRFPEYGWFGVGRKDGDTLGEFAPVFYLKSKFSIVDSGYFWLSERPHEPGSIGWDASVERIVSWVRLEHITDTSRQDIYFYNTHFDHMGLEAQKKSARMLIMDVVNRSWRNVIITGDFNVNSDTEAYNSLNSFFLSDTRVNALEKSTPPYTFVGVDFLGIEGDVIDYIFVDSYYMTCRYRVIELKSWGKVYPSDHLPVVAEIKPIFKALKKETDAE